MDRFSKKPEIWNFMKILPVEAELFRANRRAIGRTNMTKPTAAFRNSAKNVWKYIERNWFQHISKYGLRYNITILQKS